MYILNCFTHKNLNPSFQFNALEQTPAVFDIYNHAQRAAGYGHLQILKTTAGRPHDPYWNALNYV